MDGRIRQAHDPSECKPEFPQLFGCLESGNQPQENGKCARRDETEAATNRRRAALPTYHSLGASMIAPFQFAITSRQ